MLDEPALRKIRLVCAPGPATCLWPAAEKGIFYVHARIQPSFHGSWHPLNAEMAHEGLQGALYATKGHRAVVGPAALLIAAIGSAMPNGGYSIWIQLAPGCRSSWL